MTDNKNLYPQLDHIHHAFRQQLMALAKQKGHNDLKLHYNHIFSCIGEDGIRISHLAKTMDMSKQSISRLISEVEKSGYLTREQDQNDKRATKVSLSKRGHQLLEDTKNITIIIERQYSEIIGTNDFKQLKKALLNIHQHYCPEFYLKAPSYKMLNNSLLVHLEAVIQYIQKRLMKECISAGFNNLRLSYNMVLPYLANENKSISELKIIHGVSKQAIGQIANTLESYDYISSQLDKNDRRVKTLALTPKGLSLIKKASTILSTIEKEISSLINQDDYLKIITHLNNLNQKESKSPISEDELLAWVSSVIHEKNIEETHEKIQGILGEKNTKQLISNLKKIHVFNKASSVN